MKHNVQNKGGRGVNGFLNNVKKKLQIWYGGGVIPYGGLTDHAKAGALGETATEGGSRACKVELTINPSKNLIISIAERCS